MKREGAIEKVSRRGRQHVRAWAKDLTASGADLGKSYKSARPALLAGSIALSMIALPVATEEAVKSEVARSQGDDALADFHGTASELVAVAGIAGIAGTTGILTEWSINDLVPQAFDLYKAALQAIENILPEDLDLGLI